MRCWESSYREGLRHALRHPHDGDGFMIDPSGIEQHAVLERARAVTWAQKRGHFHFSLCSSVVAIDWSVKKGSGAR